MLDLLRAEVLLALDKVFADLALPGTALGVSTEHPRMIRRLACSKSGKWALGVLAAAFRSALDDRETSRTLYGGCRRQ